MPQCNPLDYKVVYSSIDFRVHRSKGLIILVPSVVGIWVCTHVQIQLEICTLFNGNLLETIAGSLAEN